MGGRKFPDSAGPKQAEAMLWMQQALQLLDETDAPADIGAHLDLAIARLREAMAKESTLSMSITKIAARSAG